MKVRLINIVGLLVLLASSCTHVSFEPGRTELQNFTKAEEEQIIDTLKYLDAFQRKGFVFRKVELAEPTLGVAYNFSFECYVELKPEIFTSDYFKPVMFHEIGHCFGLMHSPNPKDIMYHEVRFLNEYSPLDFHRFFKQLNDCF